MADVCWILECRYFGMGNILYLSLIIAQLCWVILQFHSLLQDWRASWAWHNDATVTLWCGAHQLCMLWWLCLAFPLSSFVSWRVLFAPWLWHKRMRWGLWRYGPSRQVLAVLVFYCWAPTQQHLEKHLSELTGGQVVEERVDHRAQVEEGVAYSMDDDVGL